MENDVNNEFPFTGDQHYDKLVIGFYIFRGITCFLFFIVNLPQCIYEYNFLKLKKGKLYSPRLFTFISITLFPLFRALNSFISVGLKDTRTGSVSWYFGIIDKIAFNNIKRSWIIANVITAISFLWSCSLMIVVRKLGGIKTRSISSKGFIVMVSCVGTFILINGLVLILFLKKQSLKSNTFRKSLGRTVKLAVILFILVIGLVIRNIVSAALKIEDTSNSNYIFIFITYLLEIPQLLVVMSALANATDDGSNCWIKYITFQKVIKETSLELPKDASFHDSNNVNNNSNKVVRNNSLFLNISQSNLNNNNNSINNSNINNINNSNNYSCTISSDSNNNNSSGINSSNSINNDIEMNNIK